MTNINLKHRLLSFIIALTMIVCTLPLTTIAAFAEYVAGECEHIDEDEGGQCDDCNSFLDEPLGEVVLGEEILSECTAITFNFVHDTLVSEHGVLIRVETLLKVCCVCETEVA